MTEEIESNVLQDLNEELDLYLKELKDANSPQLRMDALVLIKELMMNLNMFAEYKYKIITLNKEVKDE